MKGGGSEWKEDMRGQSHSGEGLLGILGVREHFESRDYIFCLGYFSSLEFGWTVVGVHRLLGVLGSGARNPH
jgi:hypothetical protein